MYIRRNKKRVIILLVFLAGITVVIAGIIRAPSMSGSFDPSFEVGVVSTLADEEKTSIYYYDGRGREVCRQNRLKYAMFGYLEDEAPVHNKHLYAVPQGLQKEQDGRILVDLNLKNGSIDEYTIPEKLSGASSVSYANGKVAVCNNLNGKSHVGLYDIKTGKTIIHTFDNEKDGCAMEVLLTGNAVICDGGTNGEGKNFLYILDAKTLEIKKCIKTKNDPMHFFESDNIVYFAEPQLYENDDRYIGTLDLNSNEFKEWKINVENDILSFKPIGDYLVIVDSDAANGVKSNIVTMDKSEKVIDTITINSAIMQTVYKDNYLYALGSSEDFKGTVFKILISDSGHLNLEKSFPVKSQSENIPPSFIFVNK